MRPRVLVCVLTVGTAALAWVAFARSRGADPFANQGPDSIEILPQTDAEQQLLLVVSPGMEAFHLRVNTKKKLNFRLGFERSGTARMPFVQSLADPGKYDVWVTLTPLGASEVSINASKTLRAAITVQRPFLNGLPGALGCSAIIDNPLRGIRAVDLHGSAGWKELPLLGRLTLCHAGAVLNSASPPKSGPDLSTPESRKPINCCLDVEEALEARQ